MKLQEYWGGTSLIAQSSGDELYYIPSDYSSSESEPMIYVSDGEQPAGYVLVDWDCAQTVISDDLACIMFDWDNICMDAYNDCLYGEGCDWYIPDAISITSPAIWACEPPDGYSIANQQCAQEIILNDSYCVDSAWDGICQDAYDCCLAIGCMDPIACNYDSTICNDDGSCTYLDSPVTDMTAIDWVLIFGDCIGGEEDVLLSFYADQSWDGEGEEGEWSLCSDFFTFDFNGGPGIFEGSWDGTGFIGTFDEFLFFGSGCFTLYPFILGCTDSTACNYDSLATDDDGSCILPDGCTDSMACNYDSVALCDDGTCVYGTFAWYIPNLMTPGPAIWACDGFQPAGYFLADQDCAQSVIDLDPFCVDNSWDNFCQNDYDCCLASGCIDPIACNYDSTACSDDGSCTYLVNPVTDMTTYDWTLSADVDCDGDTSEGITYFNDNQTWGEFGILGTWSLCSGFYMNDFDGFSTIYEGFWDGTGFTGTFDNGIDFSGCFTLYPIIPGCIDSTACNYDSLATDDDGSCVLPDGCTDATACNYDSTATCDDGECLFIDVCGDCGGSGVAGCVDSTACNYDSTATCDDGSCILPDGCADSTACNYDSTADCDDGSCILPDGCTDSTACNYDSTADCDDGSCSFPGCMNPMAQNFDSSVSCADISLCDFSQLGCTDTSALNYAPAANVDGGNCLYMSDCGSEISGEWYGGGFTGPYASGWEFATVSNGDYNLTSAVLSIQGGNSDPDDEPEISETQLTQIVATSGEVTFDWAYFTIDGPEYDIAYFINGTRYDLTVSDGSIKDEMNQSGLVTIDVVAGDVIGFGIDSTDDCCGSGQLDIYNFTYPVEACVYGCTDDMACVYDAAANADDGSCVYPGCSNLTACNYDSNAGCAGECILPDGCTDSTACNYDSTAACDDGTCVLPDGCTDSTACNYDSTAVCNDGTCVLPDGCTDSMACNYDSTAACDDGTCVLPDGCADSTACNYDPTAACDDGSCILPDGCTDSTACNYDSTAECDDGSCILPDGCTDATACNYDSNATCDDGSCILPDGCADATACNYDSTAACDDGSCEYLPLYDIIGSLATDVLTEETYTYNSTVGSSYNWSIEGGAIGSGQGTNSVTAIWSTAGLYDLTVVETDAEGCVGQAVTISVEVGQTGISETHANEFELYPNPATDKLNVKLQPNHAGQEVDIRLYDAAGKLISYTQSSSILIELDVQDIARGSYIIAVNSKTISSRQLVIIN